MKSESGFSLAIASQLFPFFSIKSSNSFNFCDFHFPSKLATMICISLHIYAMRVFHHLLRASQLSVVWAQAAWRSTKRYFVKHFSRKKFKLLKRFMKKWSQAATFNHNGEFIPTHRRGPDIDLFRGERILLICRKYFCLKLSSNLVKIIAHQFPGQNNCLQILNSCHYSPCQLEGQQTAPSKKGQSQEQAFTSHNLCHSWWRSGD